MCFQEITNICYIFWGKMQEISALEANIDSFQQILVKYLPFPHLDISLMTKDLTQIKVYTYFNIGDAKTLVKLKEKWRKFSRSCSIYPSFGKFWGFFCLASSKFWSSHQVFDWNCYNYIFFISLLEQIKTLMKSPNFKILNGEICRKL